MNKAKRLHYYAIEILLLILALASALVFIWVISRPGHPDLVVMVLSGISFLASFIIAIGLIIDPDTVRARQTDEVLNLASSTLACMQDGLTVDSAQKVCDLLLPATSASAVAITDKEYVLGYAGETHNNIHGGSLIQTIGTKETLAEGTTHILLSPEEIGFDSEASSIRAGIIVPLVMSGKTVGTLKLYYRYPRNINETQVSVAEGFAEILSTQMAAIELEQQTKLATSMELKALQSQINPHFLFNTINTIASLIRTDPEKARILLREFAVFYRRTLENSSDLIPFSREIDQTRRYFTFEMARFGEDRLELQIDLAFDADEIMIPAFMIQPLVENAVRHAMPSEGKLTIKIEGKLIGDDVYIYIIDDGIGMTEQARQNILHPCSETGLGIAVKNINDRIKGFYGVDSKMDIQTKLGKGTTVSLFLENGAIREYGIE